MFNFNLGSLSISIISLVLTPAAYGGTTGTVTISGLIPINTSIAVTAASGSNTLNLSSTAINQIVATVAEASNSTTGYKVTLASANAGILKNGTVGSITYTAKYDGLDVTLLANGTEVTNTGTTNSVVSVTKDLSISYTGVVATSLMAGTYSDTLTFTIAAN